MDGGAVKIKIKSTCSLNSCHADLLYDTIHTDRGPAQA